MPTPPHVLLVHYSYTQQALRMSDAMAEELREHGCEVAQAGDYDLVCVFSPTWWLTTCMPIRSFLQTPTTAALLAGTRFTDVVVCRRYWGNNHRTVRRLGTQRGGRYEEGIHFAYAGGQ